MMTFTRILVPIDFSACSEAALAHAVELAQSFEAAIDVLHVWEPPRLSTPEPALGIVAPDAQTILFEFAHTRQGKRMRRVLSSLEDRGVEEVRGRLESGDPCDTIIRVAHDGCYDLVVMGTHGRTGLAHLLLGSVAERVIRRAPCPVLTIRVPDVGPEMAIARSRWTHQHAPS